MRKSILLSALLCLFSICIPMKAQPSAKTDATQGLIMGKVTADLDTCAAPVNLQAFRVNSTSAELMWDAYEMALSHHLKVSTTALANPATDSADVFDQIVYYKPYQVTGLTPSTSYFFYVSTDCGNGDSSAWSTAGTFTTKCASVTLPYTEGFETTGDFASCWSKFFSAEGTWSSTPSATTYTPNTNTTRKSGSYSARLYPYYYISTSVPVTTYWIKSWIASPEVNTNDITTKQVTFWFYASNAYSHLHVGLMTDPSDASTFEEIANLTPNAVSTWQEVIVPFATANNTAARYVAFMVDGSDLRASSYVYVDDVNIDEAPLCPKASVVQASNLTDQTARITWLGTASSWNVKVSTTALTDPETQTADVLTTTATGSPLHLTGLTAKTSYYVYIKANCQAADSTNLWSDACHFNTTAVPAVTPYFCDFENAADNALWETINGTQTNQWHIGTATNNGGAKALYISNDGGNSNNYSTGSTSYVYATRVIQFNPGLYEITFDWKAYGEGNYDLLRAFLVPVNVTLAAANAQGMTGTTNTTPAGWIDLTNGKLNLQANWQTATYLFTSTDTCTYQLVYFWKNDNSTGTQPSAAIDNLSISPYTCAAPTNLHTSSIQANSIGLAWTPSPLNETQWEVEFSQGSNVILDTVISYNTLAIGGLSASSNYLARVRSVCGGDETSRWTTLYVTTACGNVTVLPYVESFENTIYGTGSGTKPSCWGIAQSYSTYPYISTSYNHTTEAVGNDASFYFYASSTQSNRVVLPRIVVPGHSLSDMQVTFWMYSSSTINDMTVGVMTDPTDITTFTAIQTCTIPTENQWKKWVVSLAGYTGAGEYIAFFDGNRLSTNTVYIDDIVVNLLPTCQIPTNVSATPDATEVGITWDSMNGAQSYEVVLAANGQDASTATLRQNVTGNQTVFTNLPSKTIYTVYVRSICSATDTSEWSDPLITATTRVADLTPVVTDFNDSADNAKWDFYNGTQVNKWFIGDAVGLGDSRSLYVSNNNGTSNDYTNSSISYVYAARWIKFVPGIYNISFDWKCNGESTRDLLRAYLVPATVILDAGEPFGMGSTTNTDPTDWISLSGPSTKMNLQTTWQNLSYDFTISDTVVYQLVFFWKNDGSAGTTPPAAIDNLRVAPLTCAIDVTGDIYDTYAVLSCTTNGTPVGFEVACHDASFLANNIPAEAHHVIVGPNGIDSITGLTPNTQYYAYVRSICAGGDTGQWKAYDFHTDCAMNASLPLFWDFNNEPTSGYACPSCWTRRAGASIPYVNSANGTSIYWYQSSAAGSPDNYLATPRINIPSISETRVEFKLRYTSAGFGLMVGVMSNPSDLSTFVPVDTVYVTNTTDYENYVVRFRNYTGTGKYIAFVSRSGLGTNYYAYMDDVAVYEDRDCKTPDNITATQITTNGANLSWSVNNGQNFDLLLTTALVDPNTATENDPDVYLYETSYNGNSFDLTGSLDPATVYYVYVKADCQSLAADGKPSFWSEPYRFATFCNAKTVPYTETFASPLAGVDVQPLCWNVFNEVNGTATATLPYIADNRAADNDGKSLYMNGLYQSATASVKSVAALPTFTNSIGSLMMTFSARGEANNRRLLVGVLTDPTDASSFVGVDTITLTTSWRRKIVDFTGVTATGTIAFIADGALDNATVAVNIDSINLDLVHGCLIPKNITTSNITGESVDVMVETNTTLDNMVRILVSTQNTTTPASLTSTVVDTTVNVANLPITLGGLSPLTTYYVYSAVDCGNGNYSDYYDATVSFQTACGIYTLPYTENFNSYASAQFPQCWDRIGSTTYPRTSTTRRWNSTGYSLQVGNAVTCIMPQMNIQDMSNVEMSFRLAKSSSTGTYYLYVGVITDPTSTASFVPVDTITVPYANTGATAMSAQTVNFSNYAGAQGGRIAFRATNNNVFIDEINIIENLPCAAPTNFAANNITDESVELSWDLAAGHTDAPYQIVYAAAGNDAMQNTPVDLTAGTTTYTVSGLTDNTTYNFYIRTICAAGDTSAWSTVSATTLAGAFTVPFTFDFEDATENANWQFIASTDNDGIANNFYIGTAASNGGSYGLYVSNDGGTTNGYNNGDETAIYAIHPFSLRSAKNLLVSFDYKVNGETGYDYGRVYIVPQTVNLANFDLYALQTTTHNAGWVDADNGTELEDQLTWTTLTGSADLAAGDYYLVMAWRNDGSVGTNPSIAFDNIVVREKTCYAENVSAAAGSTSAVINASTDCPTVILKVLEGTTEVVNTVTALPYNATGLTPNTNYTVELRGLCTSGDTTAITTGSFKTLCADIFVDAQNHYFEDFESYTSGTAGDMGCWIRGKDASTSSLPYVSTSYTTATSSKCAYLYSYSTSRFQYMATPNITGTAINNLRVKFKGNLTYSSYRVAVGVMTDPEDPTTFVGIDTISPSSNTWADYHVDLDQYTGTGRSVAFFTVGSSAYIDEVEILPIPSCVEADFNLTTSIGAVNIEIVPARATDTQWDVVVTTDPNDADPSAEVYAQTVTNTSVTVSGLQNVTTYYVFVRTRCSSSEQSGWTSKSIATPCGLYTLPFAEGFAVNGTATMPSCWERLSGEIGSTLTASTNGWQTNAGDNGIVGPHMKYNLYSTYKYWLVSPTITIDSTAALSFDLAKTGWNNGNAYTTNTSDDRFIVIVSTDGGNTWSETNTIAEWNSTSTTRDINAIPNTAERETISLNAYVGQNIRIAFYGESTTSGTDYDLHIGNINIDYVGAPTTVTVDLTEQVCAGVAYTNYGFNVTEATAGTYTYTRTLGDTIYNLMLTVLPTATGNETASVCASALPYLWNGQSLTAAGTYTFNTTAANGCDSVVTLTLTVLPTATGSETASVCASALPYLWNGQSLTAAGTYTFNTTAANGCDSVVTLNLTVNQGSTGAETITICDSQLPYTWNGQTLTAAGTYTHTTTAANGCDSVVTLTLVVNNATAETVDLAICDTDLPYAWNGQDLTAAGTYTHTTTAANGCDSVVTLNLTVNNSFVGTETLDLLDTELPYTWNGIDIEAAGEYTYNGTTAEGCDSVITLTVNITVGLDYAEDGMFAITPNPVERGGVVRIDANINETAVVEIYTSNGKLVSRSEHQAKPIFVTMPEVGGLYMVRLTTKTGRVMYGKVIVK